VYGGEEKCLQSVDCTALKIKLLGRQKSRWVDNIKRNLDKYNISVLTGLM
jgi:hypothetical protein